MARADQPEQGDTTHVRHLQVGHEAIEVRGRKLRQSGGTSNFAMKFPLWPTLTDDSPKATQHSGLVVHQQEPHGPSNRLRAGTWSMTHDALPGARSRPPAPSQNCAPAKMSPIPWPRLHKNFCSF